MFRLSSRAKASRHGIDCWHGSPRHALLGFLTEASAGKILPDRPVGSLGLVGHTHEPALFAYDGAATRRCGPFRASLTTGSRPAPAWPTRGRSAATHATRRAGGSSSTLTPVCCGGTATSSSPKKLPLPACEPCRSHRRVTRVRHRHTPPGSTEFPRGQRHRRSAHSVPHPAAPVPSIGSPRSGRPTCQGQSLQPVARVGRYRRATAPDQNSWRCTSSSSIRSCRPASSIGPWPTRTGCTRNSYSSISPRSAKAGGGPRHPPTGPRLAPA